MNTIVTSRDAILETCHELVTKQGIASINMRTVASACEIAVGSLYNYFPSKTDLLNAVIEDIWKDIFHSSTEPFSTNHFTDCLLLLFQNVRTGCQKYPDFFTLHSMNFATNDKEKGRLAMEHYFVHMKQNLLEILKNDTQIRPDAFTGNLSQTDFIDYIFTLFLSLLLKDKEDCSALLALAEGYLY